MFDIREEIEKANAAYEQRAAFRRYERMVVEHALILQNIPKAEREIRLAEWDAKQ